MKVGELIEKLREFDPNENIEMVQYDEHGNYMWWTVDCVERFTDDENSPVTLVAGELVGW